MVGSMLGEGRVDAVFSGVAALHGGTSTLGWRLHLSSRQRGVFGRRGSLSPWFVVGRTWQQGWSW
jgi:hypothetical protein